MALGPNVIVEKIQRVKNAWDPAHPDYAFKYYLYNQVGEERAVHYVKPPNEDLAAWEKAWADRPNKASVPVLACGFIDLDKRVKIQENQVNVFRHRLHEIQNKLTALQSRHDLVTSIKQEDCRRRHTALARRALSLAAKVQVLKNRGYALQTDEEVLKKRLEALAREVGDPAVRGRVNEIWARMMVVSEMARKMEESVGKVEIVWDQKQLETAGKVRYSLLVKGGEEVLMGVYYSYCRVMRMDWNISLRKSRRLRKRLHNGKKSSKRVLGAGSRSRDFLKKILSMS